MLSRDQCYAVVEAVLCNVFTNLNNICPRDDHAHSCRGVIKTHSCDCCAKHCAVCGEPNVDYDENRFTAWVAWAIGRGTPRQSHYELGVDPEQAVEVLVQDCKERHALLWLCMTRRGYCEDMQYCRLCGQQLYIEGRVELITA